jgi:spore germination protein YaaH
LPKVKHTLLNLIVLTLCVVLMAPDATTQSQSFPDIANSYALPQIQKLSAKGIVVGDENGYFHPNKPVTRAEFVTMLNRALGILPLPASISAYQDVPKTSWAYPWVQAGVSVGIVHGASKQSFAPKRSITRQEAAALLVRALREKPQALPVSAWADRESASPWAVPYVEEAMARGLMTGHEGTFRPLSPLTREEVAVILDRILSPMDKQDASASPSIELGWQYQSTTSQYIESVKKSSVNTLSPRWYFLQPSGAISDHTDTSLVKWAHENGKKVWPLFGNRFDEELTHKLLADETSRRSLISQMVRFVDKYHLDGINLDFEDMYPHTRAHFTAFVDELAEALQECGAVLSVDVPPDLQTDWSKPYDFQALGKSADYLVVMLYEEHWKGSPKAGSISSLPWFAMHIERMKSYVPAEKIIAGMPFYTRDWYSAHGTLHSNDMRLPDAYQLIAKNGANLTWNPAAGQYTAAYRKNGTTHTMWLEDSRSLGLKAQAAMRSGVAGFAYWHIGGESPDVWRGLQNAKQYRDVLSRQPEFY